MITYYIVPAWSDQAGQCRIVAREGGPVASPRDHYRQHPDQWKEAGLMASNGRLRSLGAPKVHYDEIAADQPLAAGMTWSFP